MSEYKYNNEFSMVIVSFVYPVIFSFKAPSPSYRISDISMRCFSEKVWVGFFNKNNKFVT